MTAEFFNSSQRVGRNPKNGTQEKKHKYANANNNSPIISNQ